MPELPRPTVWLNCAISIDGRLAYAGGRPAPLSGPEDLARVQAMRAESDAILVGVDTVRADDPSLRVHWELLGRPPGRGPTRIVLDSTGRTPPTARILDGSIPTIVATAEGVNRAWPSGVRAIVAGRGRVDLPTLLAALSQEGMHRIMVEGGSKVLAAFLRGGWFDRLTVYVAPVVIGGASAPTMVGGPDLGAGSDLVRLRQVESRPLGAGTLLTFEPAPP